MNEVLTVAEFAKRMGVETATVYAAISGKRVSAVKILGKIGVPKTEVARFKRFKRQNGDETKVFRRTVK